MLFMERQYSTFHGMTNRDDYRTIQWNTSGPGFLLKIDAFLCSCIDHGVRSNSLLENAYLWKGYFAEFENVFMCLMTYFFVITKDKVLFKIYFKRLIFSKQNAVVLGFEIVSDIKHQFLPPWSWCFSFELSKYVNVVVSLLLIFSFFLRAPMPLRLVE